MADLLLIADNFFGYVDDIRAEMERQGRSVFWARDRPALDTLTKVAIRLFPAVMAARSQAYFARVIAEAAKHPIRDVLIIKGEAISVSTILRLREALPEAYFTIYFWDSYRNMPGATKEKVAYCDRALSFDLQDVRDDPRLIYRPLFYAPEFTSLQNIRTDIDVLFFGTIHTDRYAILKRLEKGLHASIRFVSVMYFPSRLIYLFRKLFDPSFWRAKASSFIFKPVPRSEILSLISRAKVVVDIERAIQSGFTMRTIEILGAGKKIATTNAAITAADFYHPNNVLVLDRSNPHLSTEFIAAPYVELSESVLKKYSLEGWLRDVMPALYKSQDAKKYPKEPPPE